MAPNSVAATSLLSERNSSANICAPPRSMSNSFSPVDAFQTIIEPSSPLDARSSPLSESATSLLGCSNSCKFSKLLLLKSYNTTVASSALLTAQRGLFRANESPVGPSNAVTTPALMPVSACHKLIYGSKQAIEAIQRLSCDRPIFTTPSSVKSSSSSSSDSDFRFQITPFFIEGLNLRSSMNVTVLSAIFIMTRKVIVSQGIGVG